MKETSRFYSSLGLLIILNVIIKPVWIFFIDRGVQNTVGTVEYGQYFSLFNLSLVFGFLLDLGLTNYYNRQLAADPQKFIGKAGNFLRIKILFSVAYTLILLICAYLTGVKRWDIVAGVIAVQMLTFLFVFLRAIITGKQWFQQDAWLSVLDKSLMIIFCGAMLLLPSVFGQINIDKFLLLQVVCTAAAVATAFIILYRKRVQLRPGSINSLFSKKLFTEVLPYMLILLLMSAHIRLDGFLLERIHQDGAHEAGVYAASFRLLDAANMIGILFASFVLPYIAREWSSGKEISRVIMNIRHVLISFSILFSVIVIFLAPWMHQLLYKHSDSYAAEVMQWCIPSLVGYSLVSIYGTVMTATGHLYAFCKILLAALVLSTAINIILIPGMGAKGCCIAALVSQFFCGLATMRYVHKALNVSVNWYSVTKYIFIVGTLCGFLYLATVIALSPWITIGATSLLTVFFIQVTKLIDFSKWKSLIKPNEL